MLRDIVWHYLVPWSCLIGGTGGLVLVTILWWPMGLMMRQLGNLRIVEWWYTEIDPSENGKKNWERWKHPEPPPMWVRLTLGALAAAEVTFAGLHFWGP